MSEDFASEPTIQPFTPSESMPERGSRQIIAEVRGRMRQVFFGQGDVVDQVLASLLAGGHVLLEGKPGLGKTHMVLALAQAFGGDFGRIQFTPDLMPSDVTGFSLFDMKAQEFQTRKGPVFTHLLLADEINRAPAKTQASLLEVMQERQVTIDGETHKLEPPFMTLATQNPIEQEGTYPLPEAQLDRFLMKILIDYPQEDTEAAIVAAVTQEAGGQGLDPRSLEPLTTREEIIEAQRETAAIKAVPEVVKYAVSLVRATRDARGISLGAGTRGAISLIQVGKAYALLAGRDFVIPDDVKRAAVPVLRHRVQVSPELAISGQRVDSVLQQIIDGVEAPRQ